METSSLTKELIFFTVGAAEMSLEANQCHVAELQIGALMCFHPTCPCSSSSRCLKCRNSELCAVRLLGVPAPAAIVPFVLKLGIKNLW